jgi:hypothetical protein
MSSGLKFGEVYSRLSDATRMVREEGGRRKGGGREEEGRREGGRRGWQGKEGGKGGGRREGRRVRKGKEGRKEEGRMEREEGKKEGRKEGRQEGRKAARSAGEQGGYPSNQLLSALRGEVNSRLRLPNSSRRSPGQYLVLLEWYLQYSFPKSKRGGWRDSRRLF